MSEENDILNGEGEKCRRCGRLFVGGNVVCKDCEDEIEGEEKEEKNFFEDNPELCEECIKKDKRIALLEKQLVDYEVELGALG